MHPSLDRCLAIVLDATKGGGDECRTRRDPAKWSVVEIVEHLTRAYSGTAKGFERCLEKGAPLATSATLKQKLTQFALINLGFFPEGRQAPKFIIPTGCSIRSSNAMDVSNVPRGMKLSISSSANSKSCKPLMGKIRLASIPDRL